MLKNYFLVAIRNITKHKTFSFINIFGLALAMSVCLLIILMLADQRRYDKFNSKGDRIYRVISYTPEGKQPYATSSVPVGPYLKANYPAIEDAVTLTPSVTGDAKVNDKVATMKGYITEPSFFRIFDYELINGDKGSALNEPRSMVISTVIAGKLFGTNDVVGKTIEFYDRAMPFPMGSDSDAGRAPELWGSFTITGVFDPSLYTSHLKFDVLMSASTSPALIADKKLDDISNNWNWFFRSYTFVLAREGKSSDDIKTVMDEMSQLNQNKFTEEYSKDLHFEPQALADVQLGLNGNDTSNRLPIQGFYFLGFLAIVIMLSACLNYTNLSIARALTRAKEIGIRKVTGANKRSLVFQFLGESIIVSLLSLVMAIVFLQALRPAFKNLWLNQFLAFELPNEPWAYMMFAGFALLVGVIAGTFPAFRMGSYRPIDALKKQEGGRTSRWGIRRILSVSQFCVSLLFITTSILIYQQFKHYMSFDYGMKTENIVNIQLDGVEYQKAANEISQVPGVIGISASNLLPATGESNGDEVRKPGQSDTDFKRSWFIVADENFTENMGLELIAGRTVAPASDSANALEVIVNEEFVKQQGYQQPVDVIGETFEGKWNKRPLIVAGVVRDFRYQLLINTSEPGPLMIYNRPSEFKYLNVKISSSNIPALISSIESKWKTLAPHSMKYEFYDDQLAGTHRAIFDVVSILGFISFLAIVIACLGLLGMATYMTERRLKEVGIRKVMGAADWGITLLLSKAFLKVLGIAVLIGAPLSYFISNFWLEFIPNRVDFSFGTVIVATIVLLMLGLITVGSQTIKASRSNPIDALKEE